VEDLPELAAAPVVERVASFEEEHHPGVEDSQESFSSMLCSFGEAPSQCTHLVKSEIYTSLYFAL
jgi:hypothetical protein